MAAAPNDLTTVAELKDWLGINSDASDAMLQRLITAVSAGMQNTLNRNFAVQPYSEVRSGVGGVRMQVANYPLLSVTSLVIDGTPISKSADGVVQPGYVADDRGITLIGYRFARGMRNVQVSYTAGFADATGLKTVIPPDVGQACIDWCAYSYRARDRIGHQSKSVQGETVSYVVSAMPQSVAQVLSQYKKVVPL